MGPAAQGHGVFWVKPLASGPQSRTGPLPVEHFPAASKGRFASTLAGCSRKPRTVLLSPGEKRFWVVLSQGPWP